MVCPIAMEHGEGPDSEAVPSILQEHGARSQQDNHRQPRHRLLQEPRMDTDPG